jgi:hypothetical protein
MTRVLTLILSGLLTAGLAGCLGASAYDVRIDKHVENLRYQQKLDQYTSAPAQGKLQQLGVYLRPPKPLAEGQQSPLPAPNGLFDAVSYFSGAEGGVPMQLHVLARRKQGAQAKAKPGEPAPAQRGAFLSDLRTVLSSYYGPGASEGKLDPVSQRGRSVQRQKFQAANGDTILMDVFEQPGYELALVWDIAPAAANSESVRGMDYTLGSLAVGPKAANLFAGGSDDDAAAPAAGGAGGGQGQGVAF